MVNVIGTPAAGVPSGLLTRKTTFGDTSPSTTLGSGGTRDSHRIGRRHIGWRRRGARGVVFAGTKKRRGREYNHRSTDDSMKHARFSLICVRTIPRVRQPADPWVEFGSRGTQRATTRRHHANDRDEPETDVEPGWISTSYRSGTGAARRQRRSESFTSQRLGSPGASSPENTLATCRGCRLQRLLER